MRPIIDQFKLSAALFILLILPVMPQHVFAQAKISARVDQMQVVAGDTFNFTVSIEGSDATGAQIGPPDFGGLTVRGGPNPFQSITSLNGRVKSVLEYTWILQAPREGRYTIGPAPVNIGGQLSQTQPILVTATAQPIAAQLSGSLKDAFISQARTRDRRANQQLMGNLFLRAEASNLEPYTGEAVIITYKLYNGGVSLQSIAPDKTSDVTGAVAEELFMLNRTNVVWREETIDGRKYQVAMIYQQAVIPNKSGDLTIANYGLEGMLQTRGNNDDPFGDFFGGGGLATQMPAPQVKLKVKPLPPNAPADFSGTVGNYQVECTGNPAQMTEDDLFTYTVRIFGDGAIDEISPPKFTAEQDFEIAGQTAQKEPANTPGKLSGSKTFEFVLRPKHGGKLSIPALNYVLFNPVSKQYERRTGQPISVLVTPGKKSSALPANMGSGNAPSTVKRSADSQLLWLHSATQPFKARRPDPLLESPIFWLLQFTGLGIVFWAWRRNRRLRTLNPAQHRRGKAWRNFEKRLKAMEASHPGASGGDVTAKAAALEQAVRMLIADNFNLSAEGLTRPEIEQLLLQKQMSPERAARICDMLEACANVRYAPSTGEVEVRQWAHEFSRLLREGLAA